jgi:hypothetical protein
MRKLIAFLMLMAVQAACGSSPSGPGSTTTTGGTTTTGNTNATADFTVTNTPCVAPSAAPVSCTFNASASGGTAPFIFDWAFTNPNTQQAVEVKGDATNRAQTASPTLPCAFSSGVVSFNVTVTLTARPATGTNASVTRTQSITRQAGACGT